ncbi:glycosyltransferase [Nocardioides mangrovicus]|uniref:glycosyltransferase n=1 Tax=Nocardioides mangrovicus TaxID=2478913 RepID=UPI0011C3A94B|nr:glycosyltransferase [Nocardioides mangrovicus]
MCVSPSPDEPHLNPYLTQLYNALAAAGAPPRPFERRTLLTERLDVVHVHWPEHLVRWDERVWVRLLDVVKVLTGLTVARRRGARLVWTAHNLRPHERAGSPLVRLFLRQFWRRVDLVIGLTRAGVEQVHQAHPRLRRVPARVVPHGHYLACYPPVGDRAAARRALGLDPQRRVLLQFGMVRRYKNADGLVAAVVALPQTGPQLVVAGAVVEPDLGRELTAAVAGQTRVQLRPGRVEDAEVTTLHAAADVVVFPYRDGALNSGAAVLALSLGRAVVVRDTAVMRELREVVGERWVHTFAGGADEAAAVAAGCELPGEDERPDLSALAWPDIARRTLEAYADVVPAARAAS